MEHAAVAPEDAPSLQIIGQLPEELVQAFDTEVALRLEEAHSRKGDDRTAVKGLDSHLKTPGFIRSLLQNAVTSVVKAAAGQTARGGHTHSDRRSFDKEPQGGFTDVGLHTGGRHRHATWPLVCAVLYVSLVFVSCEF